MARHKGQNLINVCKFLVKLMFSNPTLPAEERNKWKIHINMTKKYLVIGGYGENLKTTAKA